MEKIGEILAWEGGGDAQVPGVGTVGGGGGGGGLSQDFENASLKQLSQNFCQSKMSHSATLKCIIPTAFNSVVSKGAILTS